MFGFLETILELIVWVSAITLCVFGFREKGADGARTKSGNKMLIIGLVILACLILIGIPEFIEGFNAGSAD